MSYTALILTTAATDYPQIRSLLGADSTELADVTIEQDPFLPAAEAMITANLTDYASLTGANSYLLKSGAAALTAAFLCPKLEREDSESFKIGQFQESGSKVDWRAKARELLELAKVYLAQVSTRTFTRRTAVALAGPTRSGSNIPEEIEQWIERLQPRFMDWVEEGGEDDDWEAP